MATHKKPTNEELEAAIQKATEEAEIQQAQEDLKNKEVPLVPEEPSEAEPTPSKPEEPEMVLEENTIEPTPSEPAPSPDYKEKFVASTKEAQVLHAKNKKTNEAIDEAAKIGDPTDEEMETIFTDWDLMGDVEKKLAKDNEVNKRRFAILHKASQEGKNVEEWYNKVDKFVTDPKVLIDNPDLEGKTDDFKIFATKPSRRGVPFEDLVGAFLYDVSKNSKPKMKSKMFETGSGGRKEPSKRTDGKISLAEANALREKDYAKYKEYLKADKIDMSEL